MESLNIQPVRLNGSGIKRFVMRCAMRQQAGIADLVAL